jgi:hypothetical protein
VMILLGGELELASLCRAVARRARVLLRAVPANTEGTEIASMHPLIIALPLALYEARPWSFEVLADRITASLLVLDRTSTTPLVLEHRLSEALLVARTLRAMV